MYEQRDNDIPMEEVAENVPLTLNPTNSSMSQEQQKNDADMEKGAENAPSTSNVNNITMSHKQSDNDIAMEVVAENSPSTSNPINITMLHGQGEYNKPMEAVAGSSRLENQNAPLSSSSFNYLLEQTRPSVNMRHLAKSIALSVDSTDIEKLIPMFIPEIPSINISIWLERIECLANFLNWSDGMRICFTLGRLGGTGETWCNSMLPAHYTWNNWKEKLICAFPPSDDFCLKLVKMVKRNKENNETYVIYYKKKMALLSECNITGERAVSCIIAGIPSAIIQEGARAENFETPEELFEYLRNIPDDLVSQVSNDVVPPYPNFEDEQDNLLNFYPPGFQLFLAEIDTEDPIPKFMEFLKRK